MNFLLIQLLFQISKRLYSESIPCDYLRTAPRLQKHTNIFQPSRLRSACRFLAWFSYWDRCPRNRSRDPVDLRCWPSSWGRCIVPPSMGSVSMEVSGRDPNLRDGRRQARRKLSRQIAMAMSWSSMSSGRPPVVHSGKPSTGPGCSSLWTQPPSENPERTQTLSWTPGVDGGDAILPLGPL